MVVSTGADAAWAHAKAQSRATGSVSRPVPASSRTGYVFHELFMWHHPGNPGNTTLGIQHNPHNESEQSKRRFNNLVHVSGMMDHLQEVRPRPATVEELTRVHTPRYVDYIQQLSKDTTKEVHIAGLELSFAPGAYEIAVLAAGGAISLVDAALDGRVTNGYALTRPPGHHAERDRGMGYCMFNNVAVAAAHALEARGLSRVAVIDYDVHHGNGTQDIFYNDDRVLLISLHQDSNFPLGSGSVTDVGTSAGEGYTINVPLPPGSGSGAYRAAFDQIVTPALDAYKPQLILVSSGFDAAFLDPLASQMCSSEDYRYFTQVLKSAAERHCQGRLLAFHEGGYSEAYVPFCGLAVLEEMAGVRSRVADPYLASCSAWGYQGLQPWQQDVVGRVAKGPLALLQQRVALRDGVAATAC